MSFTALVARLRTSASTSSGERFTSAVASLRSWVTSLRPSVWTRLTEERTSSRDRRAVRLAAIEKLLSGRGLRMVENYYASRQCQATIRSISVGLLTISVYSSTCVALRALGAGRIAQLVRAPRSEERRVG